MTQQEFDHSRMKAAFEKQRSDMRHKARGIMDLTMGIVYILFSIVPYFAVKNHFFDVSMAIALAFGALFFAYGTFRVYRAYLILWKKQL